MSSLALGRWRRFLNGTAVRGTDTRLEGVDWMTADRGQQGSAGACAVIAVSIFPAQNGGLPHIYSPNDVRYARPSNLSLESWIVQLRAIVRVVDQLGER